MRAFVIPIAAALLIALIPAAPSTQSSPTLTVLHDVMVPMRDGVKLATDVYLPSAGSAAPKLPVIMERTPYNKDGIASVATFFAEHGYAVVAQDVRARYKSEGHWTPIKDDPNDGYDTAQWIGAQAWSNGTIGTIGTSYDGATQHALAISHPAQLKTMIPVDAMSNFGHYGVRHNGAFELRWFNWVMTMGNAASGPNSRPAAARAAGDPAAIPALIELGKHVPDYVLALPLRPGTTPLKFAPDYEAWLVEAMKHGDYDDFWKNHGSSVVDHLAEYKDIPIYHVTGWYDSWGTQVANLNYIELRKAKKSLQRLIVGPWTHGGQTRAFAGEAEFTADAALDFNTWRLRWMDHWLKGADNGVDREAPVRLYIMGGGDAHKTADGRVFVGGHWRDEQEWPLARTAATPYYLRANGALSAEAPGDEAPSQYTFDPKHPAPTIGGNVSSQGELMFQGAADQRCRRDFWLCADDKPLSTRNDVLVFQTPPLDKDVEVTGRLIVKLWAATDGADTDFTAKLVDVYPPSHDYPAGIDLNVADSIVRGRNHNGAGAADLLKPGQPYEFTIEMYPTSLVFARGHRIRVDISSSNFPRFDVNPNTGEPLNDNRGTRTAHNTVYHDRAHASQIVLPIIPSSARSSSQPAQR